MLCVALRLLCYDALRLLCYEALKQVPLEVPLLRFRWSYELDLFPQLLVACLKNFCLKASCHNLVL